MMQPGTHLLAAMAASASQFPPFPKGELPGNNTVPWSIVFTLTLLTLLPAIVLSITPMVRLLVVFHFLRQALGTQTAPGNQTLMGLGLMMTWFLMQPVLMAVDQQAVQLDAGSVAAVPPRDEPAPVTPIAGARSLRVIEAA